MKKLAAIAAATAVAAIGLATPVQAYDRELYAYAAGHMIGYQDIPAPLSVKKSASFNAYSASGETYLCGDDSKNVTYPGGQYQFSINYLGRKDGMSVSVTVTQYASARAAIRAFDALKKAVKQCEGSASGQQTYEDGTLDTWSRLTTSGSVPLVTVAGVESIFVNVNYDDVTINSDEENRYSSDAYDVYTLVNDVIIDTSHYTGSELNMSTKERRAVNQVAFNAVTRWLD